MPQLVMPEAALTDDKASAANGSAVEAWGQEGWKRVGRLCRWFADNGTVLDFACPVTPEL